MDKKQALSELKALKARADALEAIINQPESYVRERVSFNGKYWAIIDGIRLYQYAEFNRYTDDRFKMGNYYHTQEEAEKARDRQLAYVRITDAIREQNKGWVPDWGERTNRKHYLRYDHDDSTVHVINNTFMQFVPNELCGTKEAIEYVIKHHADDIKLYFGVE